MEYKQNADYRRSEKKALANRGERVKLDLDISFVNFGMKGGVTALLVVDDPFAPDEAEDEFLLLVGTTHGEVYISDILSKKSLGLVHRIPARGKNPLTNKERTEDEFLMDEDDMQIYKQAGILEMGILSTTSVWIQFRGGMLGLYSWDLQSKKHRLLLEKRFVLSHPGFCRGVYDAPHERFVMPDKMVGGYTGFCMIDDHENKTIYDLSTDSLRANCKRPMDVERLKPFSGAIFFIQPYHWNNAQLYFVGFEDASLMLYDVRNKVVVEWFKREADEDNEEETNLYAIDSRPVLTGDDLKARQFVISEASCVYLLYYDPTSQQFHILQNLKILEGEKHCNSVSFGPESTHQGALPRHYPARFALGFNDGALEVYSIRYEHENGAYAIQLIATSSLHNAKEHKPSTVNRLGWSHRWNMLFAGTDDGRAIHFAHVQLEKPKKPRY